MNAIRIMMLLAVGGAALAQNVGVPVGLKVVAASKSQVQLSWTAGDTSNVTYTIERRTLTGTYDTSIQAATTSATDKAIDGFETYVYRVRANLGAAQSGPSNEVTVGPAPFGYNLVVPTPAALTDNNYFGHDQRMTLDGNGDPGVAYIVRDPNLDDDPKDSTLYFVRWDRVNYAWTKPVAVTAVGVWGRTNAALTVAPAFDTTTNTWGITYEGVNQIGIVLSSDNGATWKAQAAFTDADHGLSYPVLAMNSGKIYLAFSQDYSGIRYMSGAATAAPGTGTSNIAPFLAGASQQTGTLSLALDGNGNPAIAYWLSPDSAYNSILAYWRPGSPTATMVMDTQGVQSDELDVSLGFFGTSPRIAVYGARDDQYFARYDRSIWTSASADGTSWSTPVNLPNDGGVTMDAVISLALGPQGQGSLIMESNGGDGTPGACSFPKISRSADFSSWTTCAPNPTGIKEFQARYPSLAYAANGKLYFSATQYMNYSDVPQGIIVWREQ